MTAEPIEKEDSPFTKLCKKLEHFETPLWAVMEILKREILTEDVVDPCTGTGIIAKELLDMGGHTVTAVDIHDWGFGKTILMDYLDPGNNLNFIKRAVNNNSVVMNPPFSRAHDFVTKSLEYGARKIVCLQRFSWWESEGRADFWKDHPPSRIYICGSRATCWRHDVPAADRVDKKGRPKTTPTAHAWFIWERGHPPGTVIGHLYNTGDSP